MPPIQLPLTLAQPHSNQQLFSDHYLNITLPQRPEWKLLAHDAAQALAMIAPIVRAYVPSDNEAQTEDELIRPVLRTLGHTFEVQAALKTPDGTKKPDYVFYRDLAALNANKNRTLLSEDAALLRLQQRHPSIVAHLLPFADAARRRGDKGEYWWELRPCDYYDAFNQKKIFWPDIAKSPRFVWDEDKTRIGNTGYFTPAATPYLLGILSSRVTWFVLSQLSQAFGERAGTQRFRLFTQSMERLPIPDAPTAEREAIGGLAMQITAEARARYELHRRAQRRILVDLGTPDKALNQKLTAWWNLDFPAFRAEIQKVFKRDILLKDRDDWEEWLQARRADHQQRTEAIVRMEPS
jgi:hypothetical protein